MKLVIVDVNLERGPSSGCLELANCLTHLCPGLAIAHRHWRDHRASREALLLGPNGTPFPAYPDDFDRFLHAIKAHTGPILGICGGHQVLGLAHGAKVAPVAAVPPATLSYDGLPKVKGPSTLRLTALDHPLVTGLPRQFSLTASHVDEVKTLPPGFLLLAKGPVSPLQIIAHGTRPQFGIQCHPERPQGHPEGEHLLRNWLSLAALAT